MSALEILHGPGRAHPMLPVSDPDPTKIAVLLNRNARKVNDRTAKRIERIVGRENLFYSKTLDEAEAYTREIVQRGYGTVLTGGGDGTLSGAINLVQRYVRESNAWRTERFRRYGETQQLLGMPRFGFLRLGTGNGMTEVVGAGDPFSDLQRIVDYAPGRTHRIPLVECEGERFFFGGMGYDSMILNDYNMLRAATNNPLLRRFMHSVGGYFAALLGRTVPRALLQDTRIDARVMNHGRAYYVDPRRGDAVVPLEPGVLFEGKAAIIAAGTSPFLGYGMRVFPFANIMPGMMHLRIATIGPLRALCNLPSLWRGSYRNPELIMDFLVEDVEVESAAPYPYQHSGDAQGMRERLRWKIDAEPLQLVDCYRPVRTLD
jgi:diacylglycerol kinase family enzyme